MLYRVRVVLLVRKQITIHCSTFPFLHAILSTQSKQTRLSRKQYKKKTKQKEKEKKKKGKKEDNI